MIREEYKDVDIEVIAFEATDIVTASCVVEDEGEEQGKIK